MSYSICLIGLKFGILLATFPAVPCLTMASFAISLLTLVVALLRVQAEPLKQPLDQPVANERCIQMTDGRVDEMKQMILEITAFIEALGEKYENYSVSAAKVDIEKNIESQNDDKHTILQVFVNDCAKRSENYKLYDEYAADSETTNDSGNSEVFTQEKGSQTTSSLNTEKSSSPKNIKKTSYQVINKQNTKTDNHWQENRKDQTTIINVPRKNKSSGNERSKNYEEKRLVDNVSNENSNSNYQYLEKSSRLNQEASKTVINAEKSSQTNSLSTANASNNKVVEATSNNAAYSAQNTTSVTDSTVNHSSERTGHNNESNEQDESEITSYKNVQSTDRVINSKEQHTNKISQTTVNSDNHDDDVEKSLKSTNNEDNTNADNSIKSSKNVENKSTYVKKSQQSSQTVENENAYVENTVQSANNDANTGETKKKFKTVEKNNALDTDEFKQSSNTVENNNAPVEKTLQSTNNNAYGNKMPTRPSRSIGKDRIYADKYPYSTNDNNYANKLTQTPSNVKNNNVYKDKLTHTDETTSKSNDDNQQIDNPKNGRYTTDIASYDSEENRFVKSLRQLIRREVNTIIRTDKPESSCDNTYVNSKNIDDEDFDDSKESDAREEYDGCNKAVKQVIPHIMMLDLPSDVIELKKTLDRKRGMVVSYDPMVIYVQGYLHQRYYIM